jgi:hypothetical protein
MHIIQSNICIRSDFLSLVLRSARHMTPKQFFATGSLRRPANTRYPVLTSRTIFPFLRILFIPKVQMLSSSKLPSQTPSLPSQREREREREGEAESSTYRIQNVLCVYVTIPPPDPSADCREIWYGRYTNDSYKVFVLINFLQSIIPWWMQY